MEDKRTIIFDEASHSYICKEYGQQYNPVTSTISLYHEKFNIEFWSKKKSIETGLSQEAIKQNWKDIADFACNKGNVVHKQLEDSINESTSKQRFEFDNSEEIQDNLSKFGFKILINQANLEILAKTSLATKYPKIYRFLKTYILDDWSLYAEKRIYWADYLIAGTIDVLLIKGKNFIIVDWKTNKDELKFISGYYKKDKSTGLKTNEWINKKSYFFSPISSIEDCKGNRYTMQLSLYAYLMELWGFNCKGLFLFHIRDTQEPKLYIISYLNWACKLLCIDFKNRLTLTKKNFNLNSELEDFTIT